MKDGGPLRAPSRPGNMGVASPSPAEGFGRGREGRGGGVRCLRYLHVWIVIFSPGDKYDRIFRD